MSIGPPLRSRHVPRFTTRFEQTSYNEDSATYTYIALEETAAGNPDIEAIIVMDGVTDAWVIKQDGCTSLGV